jgi:type II secretory pathway pseudopilin PulG
MENLAQPISKETKEKLSNQDNQSKKKKYSIFEILVVLSAIGVVAVLALLAINPGKEGAESRNAKRRADTSYILAEVTMYSKSKASIPNTIPTSEECVGFNQEICKTGPYDCSEYVDLSFLNNPDSNNVTQMPSDPLYVSVNGTGYYISQDGLGSITVCAPYAERHEEITFTKYLY